MGPSSVVGVESLKMKRRSFHVMVRFSARLSDVASLRGFWYLSNSSSTRMRMGLLPSRDTEPDQPR